MGADPDAEPLLGRDSTGVRRHRSRSAESAAKETTRRATEKNVRGSDNGPSA